MASFLTECSHLPSLRTLTASLIFISLFTRSVVVLLSVSCPSITFDQNGSNQFQNSKTQMGNKAKSLCVCAVKLRHSSPLTGSIPLSETLISCNFILKDVFHFDSVPIRIMGLQRKSWFMCSQQHVHRCTLSLSLSWHLWLLDRTSTHILYFPQLLK